MSHRVEISRTAETDAEAAFLFHAHFSRDRAVRWYRGLLEALASLESFPSRCPEAPESATTGTELRLLVYGRGKQAYRILFTIDEARPGDAEPVVRILHVGKAASHDSS
jgi:plasmid stabilization system protein ParE